MAKESRFVATEKARLSVRGAKIAGTERRNGVYLKWRFFYGEPVT
jgi:hypothetical protein